MVEVRESRSMAAAATARAVAAARAREVARGGGDVRERASHGENENGLERKKNGVGWEMKNGFLTFKSLRSGSRMKRKKEKKLEKKALGESILSRFMEHVYATHGLINKIKMK